MHNENGVRANPAGKTEGHWSRRRMTEFSLSLSALVVRARVCMHNVYGMDMRRNGVREREKWTRVDRPGARGT